MEFDKGQMAYKKDAWHMVAEYWERPRESDWKYNLQSNIEKIKINPIFNVILIENFIMLDMIGMKIFIHSNF